MAGAVGDDTDPYHPFSFILLMADMVQWEITRIATTMIHFCGRRIFVWGQGPKDPGNIVDKQIGQRGYIKNGSQWLVPCPCHRLIPVGCPVQVMHRLGPEGMTESALGVNPLAC